MVALGLTSGLLLVDAERQRSNMVNAKQLQTTNAVAKVIANLQTWLGTEGVIKASFEGEIVSTTALDPDIVESANANIDPAAAAVVRAEEAEVAATTTLEKENAALAVTAAKAALAATEAAAQRSLRKVVVGGAGGVADGVVRLKQEKIGEINFIGKPDGPGKIQALDGHNGWAYIKAMWIDNFQPSNTVQIDIGGTTIAASEGAANLNVRTWVFLPIDSKTPA